MLLENNVKPQQTSKSSSGCVVAAATAAKQKAKPKSPQAVLYK
jgi:hypothetical protein